MIHAERFLRRGLRPFRAGALLCLAAALAGCISFSEPPQRKRSFMASAEGVRTSRNVPVGLNPLGMLETCAPGPAPPVEAAAPREEARVLVSRPEHFTHEASLMIAALRDALARSEDNLPPVQFQLAPREIGSAGQAQALGRGCAALIVLWEPQQTKSLELTLPDRTRVPLRDLVQERLCEFGSHTEQLNILYLTIAGLLSLRDNQYDRAVLYMNSARAIDTHCLHLPGMGPPRQSEPDSPPQEPTRAGN